MEKFTYGIICLLLVFVLILTCTLPSQHEITCFNNDGSIILHESELSFVTSKDNGFSYWKNGVKNNITGFNCVLKSYNKN